MVVFMVGATTMLTLRRPPTGYVDGTPAMPLSGEDSLPPVPSR